MARHGKIARLPKWLRDTLNEKLREGETGVAVVAWLKALWEENEDIADAVGPDPVTEQNLCAWRQGGYRDWERRQAAAELVHNLAEHGQDLREEADGWEVSDRLAHVLTGEMAQVAEVLLAETKSPRERWELLKDMQRELTRVRQVDHRAAKLAREEAERERARQQAQAAREAREDPVLAVERWHRRMFKAKMYEKNLAFQNGNTKGARIYAAAEAEAAFGLPMGTLVKLPQQPSPDGGAASPPASDHEAAGGQQNMAEDGELSKIKENQGEAKTAGEEAGAPEETPEAEDGGIKDEEESRAADPPSSDFVAASPASSDIGAPSEEQSVADDEKLSKIKENPFTPKAAHGLPPGIYSTIREVPGYGTPAQAEEPPEEWEDGGWMKKRSRRRAWPL